MDGQAYGSGVSHSMLGRILPGGRSLLHTTFTAHLSTLVGFPHHITLTNAAQLCVMKLNYYVIWPDSVCVCVCVCQSRLRMTLEAAAENLSLSLFVSLFFVSSLLNFFKSPLSSFFPRFYRTKSSFLCLIVNKSYTNTKPRPNFCPYKYCVYHILIYLPPLCHRAPLLSRKH